MCLLDSECGRYRVQVVGIVLAKLVLPRLARLCVSTFLSLALRYCRKSRRNHGRSSTQPGATLLH